MHDATNTVGGKLGFFVLYPDGRRISERECLWDELPKEPIAALGLVDFEKDTVLMDLRGYERFYFSNEAVSIQRHEVVTRGIVTSIVDKAMVTTKIFGGVKGPLADEVRIAVVDGVPRMESKRTKPAGEVRFAPRAFRAGVPV